MGVASADSTAAESAPAVATAGSAASSSPAAVSGYSQTDSRTSQSLVVSGRMLRAGGEGVGGAESRGSPEEGGAPVALKGVASAGDGRRDDLLWNSRRKDWKGLTFLSTLLLLQPHSHTGFQEPDRGDDWSVNWNVDWDGDWNVDWNVGSGVQTPQTPPQERVMHRNQDWSCWNGKHDVSWLEWNLN